MKKSLFALLLLFSLQACENQEVNPDESEIISKCVQTKFTWSRPTESGSTLTFYDERLNVKSIIRGDSKGDSTKLYHSNSYDELGRLVNISISPMDDNSSSRFITYSYFDSGEMKSRLWEFPNNDTYRYWEYNEGGDITLFRAEISNSQSVEYKYQFNAMGLLTISEYYLDNVLYSKETRTYNDKGQLIEYLDDQIDAGEKKIENYSYDDSGNLIKETTIHTNNRYSDLVIDHSYNSNNLRTSSVIGSFSFGEWVQEYYKYEYSSSNQLNLEYRSDNNRDFYKVKEQKYYADGVLKIKKTYRGVDGYLPITKSYLSQEDGYDPKGNQIFTIQTNEAGNIEYQSATTYECLTASI